MQKVVSAVVGLAIVPMVSLFSAAPAHAAVGCYPVGFGAKYDVSSASSSAVITHAYNWVLAPGGSISRSQTITKVASVTAGVSATSTGSIEASGVIARAKAELSVTLQASGTGTYSSSVTRTIQQTNSTSSNREYVYYRGTIKYKGNYKITYCNSSTYQEYYKTGTWSSWTVEAEGTVRCDLTAPNRVSQRAKDLYCG